MMATFVGAQARVLIWGFIVKIFQSNVVVVLVLPVPGGPHIRSIEGLCWQTAFWMQLSIATFWDSFNGDRLGGVG